MAGEKQYLTVTGTIQKFGDKPAVESRDVNGQKVRNVVVKAAGSQKLIRVTAWPEHAHVVLSEGGVLIAEGQYTTSGDQGQFHNISARVLWAGDGKGVETREVANKPAAQTTQSAPAGDDPPPF